MDFPVPFHQKPCQVETKKLLFLIGIITIAAFAVQIFSTPYHNTPSNEAAEMGKQMDNETEVVVVNNKNEVTEMGEPPVGSPITSPSNVGAEEIVDANFSASDSVVPVAIDKSAVDEQVLGMDMKEEKPILIQSAPATLSSNSTETSDRVKRMSQKWITSMLDEMILPSDPLMKIRVKMPPKKVTSISEMNVLLHKNRASLRSMKPRWSSKLDQEILAAKAQIENAPVVKKDRELYAPVYRNVSVFKRSYELMEEILKVYVYKEGGKPIFHDPILEGIYASEGWFMKQMEGNEQFTVEDPREAHLFYIPFSSQSLRFTLYKANSHSKKNLIKYMSEYLNIITAKYPFWNRTGGADHFFTACHDWAPAITKRIMSACLRALCNSDVYEGFVLGKDVALPETFVLSKSDLLKDKGGKPPSQRRTLAIFAGNMHGYLHPDMKIYGKMTKTQKKEMNYIQHMKTSKFCISAKGYEGNSPRVVEAIFFECVPVIISDNFVPPFFEVLNWEAFAVFVAERDIPNLKEILDSIPDEKYVEMHKRVKKVQKHFLWHIVPATSVYTQQILWLRPGNCYFFIGIITCAAFCVQIFLTPYENVFRSLFLVNNAPAGDSSLDISVMGENCTETIDPAKKTPQKSIKTMLAEMIPSSNRMKRTWMKMPPNRITSISAMSRLLLKNLAPSHSMRPKRLSEQDREILAVKSQIENAPIIQNHKDLYAPIYRNLSTFRKTLKVYIYKEGEKPFFHDPILEGVYASEGWFMKQMEENKKFVPDKNSIRYSSLYDRKTRSKANFIKLLSDYLDTVKAKYPFWNRSFFLPLAMTGYGSQAPIMTRPFMNGCIRAFCNSDVNDDFVLGKDVPLAETLVLSKNNLLKDIGGKPPSERHTLAFFEGNIHGYLRPILLKFWEDKDPDMQIYGKMNSTITAKMNYIQRMKSSKYCISAKGYEVASPRVVEAIFFECVPVIISDNYVPPFFEVLDWESFAVFVAEKDIPNLKEILLSIPEEKYIEMHKRVKKVQQHFLWHNEPVKYDIFHMTLHSIWYNRVFQA
ncbi:hypothetical protein MKX03_002698 [Papaver bracteatum]|nr:hypothetical protein MKX03_002698 [Papaver bracteatum]